MQQCDEINKSEQACPCKHSQICILHQGEYVAKVFFFFISQCDLNYN